MKRLLLFLMLISCVNFSFSQSWGIVGSATPNGWNGIDIPMTYNIDLAIWEATVELGNGEIKFRADNNWSGINYGDVSQMEFWIKCLIITFLFQLVIIKLA